MRFHIICFLLLCIATAAYGQEVGKPFIQNFPPESYQSDGQNWDLAQDHRGFIYVANTSGVLEYDGKTWRKIWVGDNLRIVSHLAADPAGNIFVAASALPYNELGYLLPDEKGQLQYHSITQTLDTAQRDLGEVSHIFPTEKGIYFVGSKGIIKWAKGEEPQLWKAAQSYRVAFFLEEKLYVQDGKSWFLLQEDQWKPLPDPLSTALTESEAVLAQPYAEQKYLLASRNQGLFIWDLRKGQLTPFPSPIKQVLIQNNLRHFVRLPNQNYAFATSTAGIVVIDKEGNIERTIDRGRGLIENEVDYLYVDNQNGLWAALGNGVARIELSVPISYWYDEVGGWVTSVARHNGVIYAGSLGVYALNNGEFKPVEGIDQAAQAWRLKSIPTINPPEGKLLYGCDEGVYEINGQTATLIVSNGAPAYTFEVSDKYKNRIYIGQSGEVLVLSYQQGKWVRQGKLEGFRGQIRSIEEDSKGNLWLNTINHGIWHAELDSEDKDFSKVKLTEYGLEDGLPSTSQNRVYKLDSQVVFATVKGIYQYREESRKFEPIPKYEEFFQQREQGAYLLNTDWEGDLWISPFKTEQYPIAQITQASNGELSWYDMPLRRLPAMEMEAIIHEKDQVSWIAGSEGLFRFDRKQMQELENPYRTYIRKVIVGKDSLAFDGAFRPTAKKEDTEVMVAKTQQLYPEYPYGLNSLKIHFSAPSFDGGQQANEYRYRLKGYREQWSEWSKERLQAFTNLSAGNYTFEVIARNVYGAESKVATYDFAILPPWYMTVWAYIAYAIIAILAVAGVVKLNTRRLKALNQQLEQTVQERTAEIAEQKSQVEKAYNNIQTISEIGQKITATLNFDELVKTVYKSVNELTHAEAFGVGVYQESFHHLAFLGFLENGNQASSVYDSLNDSKKLSVYSFKNLKPVFINDMEAEYESYTGVPYDKQKETTAQSAIYLPLLIEQRPVGIITVQSFEKNAYSNIDLTLLQTLASYVAIALSNTTSYGVIKEKNQMITSSIRYAQSIQQAVLPTTQKLKQMLPQSFLIYKGKDIVSGDFYWTSKREGLYYIAVVDCTGHGVPGAFMSLIGYSIMNEAINQHKMTDPASVLQYLHDAIFERLRQENGGNRDGMDMGLAIFKPIAEGTYELSFAGAKNKLLSISSAGELSMLDGNKRAIGGIRNTSDSFENFNMECHIGDMVYLYSDGYIDQSNIKRRKFGTRKFISTIKDIYHKDVDQQKEALLEALSQHQGKAAQRDDITVLGFRISE